MCGGGHVMSVKEKIETLDVVAIRYAVHHPYNNWTDIARKSIHIGTTRTSVYTFCLLYGICTPSKPSLVHTCIPEAVKYWRQRSPMNEVKYNHNSKLLNY